MDQGWGSRGDGIVTVAGGAAMPGPELHLAMRSGRRAVPAFIAGAAPAAPASDLRGVDKGGER